MDATCTDAIREIPLSRGLVALIDEADWPLVSICNWWATSSLRQKVYAANTRRVDGRCKLLLMHRLILGVTGKILVDHKDGNGLNNRRSNLRTATHRQNAANCGVYSRSKNRFKGVCWRPGLAKWQSQIKAQDRIVRLGSFATEEEAARAYDEAALRLFGAFARLNFPREATVCH